MNSEPYSNIDQCACCGNYRHVELVSVKVVEISLIGMNKSVVHTGRKRQLPLCNICNELAITNRLWVTDNGERITFVLEDGRYYSDVFGKNNSKSYLL